MGERSGWKQWGMSVETPRVKEVKAERVKKTGWQDAGWLWCRGWKMT